MTWHRDIALEVAAEFATAHAAEVRTSDAVERSRYGRVAAERRTRAEDHVREKKRAILLAELAALAAADEPTRTYRRSRAPLEERCRGLNAHGYQCAMSRLDCRSNHGGRNLEDAFSEYREQLGQMSAEAIEVELVALRGQLAVKDSEYALLRETNGTPDEALLAESQRLRTKMRLAEYAAGRLRKQPHGYVYQEEEYEDDEVSDAVDE